jgi:hypothetical protein
MDILNDIPDWLKTTIPGIIILGACGSLLAIALIHFVKLLLRFSKFIFKKILPRQAKRIALAFLKLLVKVVYAYGQRWGRFSVGDPALGATFYCSYHVACAVCLLILSSSMAIIVFIIILGTKSSTILTTTTFSLTMSAFLLGFWSLRHFLYIFLPYHNYIDIITGMVKEGRLKLETPNGTSDINSKNKQPQHPSVSDK